MTGTSFFSRRAAGLVAGWAAASAMAAATAWAQLPPPSAPAAAAPAAQVDAPPAEQHGSPGIGARKVHGDKGVVPTGGDRSGALRAIENRISCVCLINGDLAIDASKGLSEASCPCPYAAQVRADLADSLSTLSADQLANKQVVAEQLESTFVPKAAEYERVFRYPVEDFNWWMDNVRCVCDGCKPTVFFSKCQLSCSPAILYKLRSRIFFAMGFSRDEMLDYYLAEYNADKAPRLQKDRAWLLPRKERDRAWMVPLFVLLGAIATLALAVRRWAGKRGKAEDDATASAAALAAASPAATPAEAEAATAATAAARARLLDELDRDEED